MSGNKRKPCESDEESVVGSCKMSPAKVVKPKHPLGLSGFHRYMMYTRDSTLIEYSKPVCRVVFFEVGCEKPGGLADYYREEKNMRHVGSGELIPPRVRPVYVRQDTGEEVPSEFLKKAMYDRKYHAFVVKDDRPPLKLPPSESRGRRSIRLEGIRLEPEPAPGDTVLTYEEHADSFGLNQKGIFLVGFRECKHEEEVVCLNKVGKKIHCMAPLSYLTLPGSDVSEETQVSSTWFRTLLRIMEKDNLIATFMWVFRKGGVLKRIEARVNKDSTGLVVHEVAFRENIVDLGNLDFPVQPRACEECDLGLKRRRVSRAELQQEWLDSQKTEGAASSSFVPRVQVSGRNLVFQCLKCCRTFHDQDFKNECEARRNRAKSKVVCEEQKIYGIRPDSELVGFFEKIIAHKTVSDESVDRLFANPERLLKPGFRRCMAFGESEEIPLDGIPGDFLRHVVPLDPILERALRRSSMFPMKTDEEESEVKECLRGALRRSKVVPRDNGEEKRKVQECQSGISKLSLDQDRKDDADFDECEEFDEDEFC